MNPKYILFALLIGAMVMSCSKEPEGDQEMNVTSIDFSKYSSEKPDQPLHLLFIHHSCGGQLFADKGDVAGNNCINPSHPNGGGLRSLLEENNYIVHEASYGSVIGAETDICHWNTKFRDHMDKILTCKHQDEFFTDGKENNIIMFKSCFPNSWIESDGTEPGDPDSCEHTIANYKASYNALLKYFSRQTDTLFVVVTAPPLVQPSKIKSIIKTLLGRSKGSSIDVAGQRIRYFNNWLKDIEKGWLKGYKYHNVVVFDYYDILTDKGKSNWSMYGSGGGSDSHPSSVGNSKAAKEFILFLNQAVNRKLKHIPE
ncbi:MAG TPA: hypothetical protein PLX41_07100 [Bacteroidales bacterium]|nr:hypothetical protein [Bacteroidales bacterium]